jgi:uridine kinase
LIQPYGEVSKDSVTSPSILIPIVSTLEPESTGAPALSGRAFVAAVTGKSGAGKTTLAERTARVLADPVRERSAVVVPLDAYYHAYAHLPFEERARQDYDHPDALDWDLLLKQIGRLAQGRPVFRPRYLFDRHTRGEGTVRVPAAGIVILEGMFAFDPRLRPLVDFPMFIDVPDSVALARCLRRDVAERGRTPESVHEHFQNRMAPGFKRHVEPFRSYARLALRGEDDLDALAAQAARMIQAAMEDETHNPALVGEVRKA